MTPVQVFWKIVALTAVSCTVVAKPSCKLTGRIQTEMVCTPGNKDYALTRGLVSDNNRTTMITLRACRIKSVALGSFEALFGLQYLDLSQNKISNLELGVLDGDHDVLHLNLSYNQLTGFPLGLFDEKPNLEVLDLKGNRIISLELGIFDTLPKLKHLDLSNNALLGKDLTPYIFDQSPHIRLMDFSGNDMSRASDILLNAFQELDILNLEGCFLTIIPKFLTVPNLKSMKHLMLSKNNISKLVDEPDIFASLENLEILNLAENLIESVHVDVFKPLRKLKMIVLRNNNLQTFPDTLFQNMDKLGNIDLSHNNIVFVPVAAFRGTALKNLNLSYNKFSYLTDNFCLELRNSGTKLTKFYFNDNPWQCACLKQILNEAKALDVGYNKWKYNGEYPVCAITRELYCVRQQAVNLEYITMYYRIIEEQKS